MTDIKTFMNIYAGATEMMRFINIQAGEEVLLLAEDPTDPNCQVINEMARKAGARVNIMWPEFGPNGEAKVFNAAYSHADTLIYLSYYQLEQGQVGPKCKVGWMSMVDRGLKHLMIFEPLDSEASRWPLEIGMAAANVDREKLNAAREWRVTDERGTDLRGKFKPGIGTCIYVGEEPGVCSVASPGFIAGWPFGSTGWSDNEEKAHGVVYLDSALHFAKLEKPIKVVIEDGNVVAVEGDRWARELDRRIRMHPNGLQAAEIGIGHNPRIPLGFSKNDGAVEGFGPRFVSKAGTFYIGFGGFFRIYMGTGTPPCPSVEWGLLYWPTIYAGEECIVDRGRSTSLDDPAVREIARKYGNPDDLLGESESHHAAPPIDR